MSRYIAIEGCKECPHRHYYSAGAYECLKYGTVLPASHILDIPAWCPLPKLPTPASAQETGAPPASCKCPAPPGRDCWLTVSECNARAAANRGVNHD